MQTSEKYMSNFSQIKKYKLFTNYGGTHAPNLIPSLSLSFPIASVSLP